MKQGTIILSGGGNMEQTCELDKKYFARLGPYAKILYIPLAMEMTTMTAESCYVWFSKLLSYHDAGNSDIDFTMITDTTEVPDFTSYDSLYLGGGNTYKLLHYILTNELGPKISQLLERGGVIYGGSAGAIVLGRDIRTAESENDKNCTRHNGLNLLNGKSIACHYTPEQDRELLIAAKKISSDIIALPEDAGLLLNNSGTIIETVGSYYNFLATPNTL